MLSRICRPVDVMRGWSWCPRGLINSRGGATRDRQRARRGSGLARTAISRPSTPTAPGSDDGADPWAWVLEEGEEPRLDVSQLHVTAVLVAFDAARWLPVTLDALARLEHRPNRLIAIDNDSTDATRTLLEQARDQGIVDAVYSGSEPTDSARRSSRRYVRTGGRPVVSSTTTRRPRCCPRRPETGRGPCPGSAPRTGSGCCTTTGRRHRTRSTGCSRT